MSLLVLSIKVIDYKLTSLAHRQYFLPFSLRSLPDVLVIEIKESASLFMKLYVDALAFNYSHKESLINS